MLAWLKRTFAPAPVVVEEAPVHFMPMIDFFSPEMQSQYTAGLRYTAQPGNTKLTACVANWRAEGKVQIAKGPAGRVHGKQ